MRAQSNFSIFYICLAVLIAFSINGCVDQFKVPDSGKDVIKAYERIIVYGNSRPWTKSKIHISEGDQLFIFASGAVTVWRGHQENMPPHRKLMVKIGEKGYPLRAVGSHNQTFYRPSREGQLMFTVLDWDRLDPDGNPIYEVHCDSSACNYYDDNLGRYQVDVFVFSESTEDEIVGALKSIAEANPQDDELRAAIEYTLLEKNRYRILLIASDKARKEIDSTKQMIKELKEQTIETNETQAQIAGAITSKPQLSVDEKDQRIQELEKKLVSLTETLQDLEKLKRELEQGQQRINTLSQELEKKEEMEIHLKSKLESYEKAAPIIVVATPKNGSDAVASKILFAGVAEDDKGIAHLEIFNENDTSRDTNDRGVKIAHNENPKRVEFAKTIKLSNGPNIIQIRATDTDNMVTIETLTINLREHEKNMWAVIIGIDDYQHVRKLKYAVKDAQAVYHHFVDYVGLPQQNVTLLTNEDANLTSLRSTLGTYLKRKAGREDSVIIYFAGHGSTEKDSLSQDGDGLTKYLLPVDAKPDDLYATALPMNEISQIFNRIGSDRLIFICDACYSGASGGRTISFDGIRANISDSFLDRMARGKGRVIITASGPNEVSTESDQLKHGVFTYYFLRGLRGQADADKDSLITVDELYQYISIQVPRATQQAQHPVKKGAVEGQIVLGVVE